MTIWLFCVKGGDKVELSAPSCSSVKRYCPEAKSRRPYEISPEKSAYGEQSLRSPQARFTGTNPTEARTRSRAARYHSARLFKIAVQFRPHELLPTSPRYRAA